MSDLLRFSLYAALVVAALLFGVFWLLAFVVVWAIEAVVAARRDEPRPPFRVPYRRSHERIGRTATVFLLLLIGLGASVGTEPESEDADDATVAAETAPAPEPATAPAETAPGDAEELAADRARARRARARRAQALRARRARALRIRRARALRLRRERAAELRRRRAAEAREAERERRAQLAPPPAEDPPDASGGCADGYSPCVPPYPPDVDCGDVSGPVTVTGPDPHGLDGDGDGTGCDAN